MIDPWDFSHDHTTPRVSIVAVILLAVVVVADAIEHQIDKRLMDTPRARLIIGDVLKLIVFGMVVYIAVRATA